jgi:uncharacterized protein YbjQ (UPF0145 family)
MLVTTLEQLAGYTEVEYYGIVSGSTVRAKNITKDIGAILKNIIGGELKGYTELMDETRDQALARMIEQAKHKGANAVLAVRFSTSDVAKGAAEIFAYGTAVKVTKNV